MCSTACLDSFVFLCNLIQAGYSGIPDALALIGQTQQQDGQQVHRESPTGRHSRLCISEGLLTMACVALPENKLNLS